MICTMKVEALDTDTAVAERAAAIIAAEARAAVNERGRFVLAVSGGHSPRLTFRSLASLALPWSSIHIVQVDERVAPEGDSDRNLTLLRESLLDHVPLPPGQVHPMPVGAPDLEAAAAEYAATLRRIAGSPAVIDLTHLGLGPDGHTASLVPGDPVLNITDREIGITGLYQGRRRMTLTYPALNRSRRILWVVTGSDKAPMVARLLDGDPSIPAGRIRSEGAVLVTDSAAAATLER